MFRQQKNPKGQENLSYIHTLLGILLVAVTFGGKVKDYIKQRKKVYEDKASLPATTEFGSGLDGPMEVFRHLPVPTSIDIWPDRRYLMDFIDAKFTEADQRTYSSQSGASPLDAVGFYLISSEMG